MTYKEFLEKKIVAVDGTLKKFEDKTKVNMSNIANIEADYKMSEDYKSEIKEKELLAIDKIAIDCQNDLVKIKDEIKTEIFKVQGFEFEEYSLSELNETLNLIKTCKEIMTSEMLRRFIKKYVDGFDIDNLKVIYKFVESQHSTDENFKELFDEFSILPIYETINKDLDDLERFINANGHGIFRRCLYKQDYASVVFHIEQTKTLIECLKDLKIVKQ
ncbi:hypothetical protein [Peptostreptococcus faecalis]|uniref:hypothetical protein n=1 Tax=Peptostreptococcus faecalis TaxID=2045015 RepID=UPI0011AF2E29|nr:hypothetical protein [Peptostreptococcus faecalis]